MKRYIFYTVLCFTLLSGRALAQLSPGDLSNAHAKLEGVSNCTQCHVLGDKVSNDKCLACHKEIKTKIDKGRGYHVSKDVKGKECASCHSDHHGRKFDLVRFDEKNFNHSLAGYELTGAHKKIDCRECHKPDYVADVNLKKKKETYLGLEQPCLSCHTDYHQKTLPNDCAKCHTVDAFAPASKFNHDKADFVLVGKHKTVACIECHLKETKNGVAFQRFANVPFTNCNSCHKDAHNNHLGTNCKECHSEQSFTSLAGLSKFNHNKTKFPLKGQHKQTDCAGCHKMEATPLTIFQDRLGVKTDACATCHKDAHEGKFGTNCVDCHNETSFRKVGRMEGFDHNQTKFALKGKHVAVDCRKCHISERLTDPLPHNTCASCHKDYHEGQFKTAVKTPDCAECHTVDGFAGSTFTLEKHAQTKFALTGAHIATPCNACHWKEKQWKFRKIGERCVDCHKDVHVGEIDVKWYPNQTCENCHTTESWTAENQFDHAKTQFKLQGAHVRQDCRACHVPDTEHKHGKFAGLPATCHTCHEDAHQKQFEKSGVTDCARCHSFEDWTMNNFDHNKTRFKLDGKHATVACEKCHLGKEVNGSIVVQYKFESFDCIVCHK